MAVDLSSLLEGGIILPVSNATSRKHVIMQLAEALSRVTGIETRTIQDVVMERERLGSTAVGEGVAIPHARHEGLPQPIGAFMRLEEPVDFEAIDDRACDLIFMLLAPLSAGADHLRALAQVSRAFRQSSVRQGLRQASSAEDMRQVLCKVNTSNAA